MFNRTLHLKETTEYLIIIWKTLGVVHKLHQHFFTNFWPPLPPHQQPSAIHRHPLPHMSSFNFFTLLPLSCNSFQSKVRGVMRFLLKFHFYLNVKVHNIPFGTPTILTQKISYTRQITQKRNKKWKNFTNFLLTSAIYEHPLPHISNHQHFATPSPPQKCWRNLWTTPSKNDF